MDRCALFVDAGYVLADGAMAVHGTRRRDAVSWDYSGLLELLNGISFEHTRLPLLRCYWYEVTAEGRRAPEHDALADIPGLKLRLGRVRPGRREGVDLMAYRDLTTLAREHALCDAVLVSGDEDMVHAVTEAQDYGVRVTGVHVAVDGNWTISRTLRQECDELIEVVAPQLRPYVNLLHGVDTSSPPLSNGQAHSGPLSGNLHHAPTGGAQRMRGHASAHSGPQAMPSAHAGQHREQGFPNLMPGHPSGPTYMPEYGPGPGGQGPEQPPGDAQPPGDPGRAQGPSGPFPQQHQFPPTGPPPAQPPYEPAHSPPSHGMQSPYGPPPAPSSEAPPGYGPPSAPSPEVSGPQGAPSSPSPQVPPSQPTGPGQSAQQGVSAQPGQSQEQTGSPTLSDAVQAAHQEGRDFGDSVARDAPALWLEAVLARKPRMPSDLEARLLQGSSLPIDFLLHDEVRHALRRGFWEALENSRRS